MLARRNDYVHPLETLDREFGRVLGRLWGANGAEVPSTLAPYAVNVYEDADHFHVEAELPGFAKDEVEITLEDGVLTIRAERQDETNTPQNAPHNRQPLHIERRWTRFERSFTLPTAVDENSVQARLDNGVLAITLNKREEVKPRKIHITAGNGNAETTPQNHPARATTPGKNGGQSHPATP
jgi:HSP20 family protein